MRETPADDPQVMRLDKLIDELARLDGQHRNSTVDAHDITPPVVAPRQRPQPQPQRSHALVPALDDADLRSRAGALLEGALAALLAELNKAESTPLGTSGRWSLDAHSHKPHVRAETDARISTLESLNTLLKPIDRDETAAPRGLADAGSQSARDSWTAHAPPPPAVLHTRAPLEPAAAQHSASFLLALDEPRTSAARPRAQAALAGRARPSSARRHRPAWNFEPPEPFDAEDAMTTLRRAAAAAHADAELARAEALAVMAQRDSLAAGNAALRQLLVAQTLHTARQIRTGKARLRRPSTAAGARRESPRRQSLSGAFGAPYGAVVPPYACQPASTAHAAFADQHRPAWRF